MGDVSFGQVVSIAVQVADDGVDLNDDVLGNFDMGHIEEEKKYYTPLPKKYCFENEHEKEVMLARNFRRINEEVTQLTASLLGKENG